MPTSHCTRARRPARRRDESGPREGDHARPYAVRIRNAVMRSLHVGSGFAGPMINSAKQSTATGRKAGSLRRKGRSQ